MWFQEIGQVDWSKGEQFLKKTDPALRALIKRVGPCTLSPRRDYFVKLCQSIFSQQLSTKVAEVLFNRFRAQFPARRPTPQATLRFLQSDDELIRSVGLSRQKRSYIADLATKFASGEVQTRKFARMDDEAIVQAMLPIKGIGRWTVEMFLIFCLNRTDVWPIDDLGIKKGVQVTYGLPTLPDKKALITIAEKWRPYRTLASWYLWRSL